MKKIFMIFAMASVMMPAASCGNNTTKSAKCDKCTECTECVDCADSCATTTVVDTLVVE